jgi:hypothetical protein
VFKILKKQTLIISTFLLGISSVQATEITTPSKIISDFFVNISKNKSDQAIDNLMDSNPELKREKNQIYTLKSQLKNYPNFQGEYQFNELFCKQKIGEHLVNYIYLVGYKDSPMLFNFWFYKSTDTWRIKSIDTDRFNIDVIKDNAVWCDITK